LGWEVGERVRVTSPLRDKGKAGEISSQEKAALGTHSEGGHPPCPRLSGYRKVDRKDLLPGKCGERL
jgi:hypothetical protein